jgi:hypothetical protein
LENPCPKLLLKQVVEAHGVSEFSPGGFSRRRTLLEYLRIFPTEVGEKIAALGGDALILEAGSGEGVAAEQMLQSRIDALIPQEKELFERDHARWELTSDPSGVLKRIGDQPLKDRPKILAVSKEMERKIDTGPYQGKLETMTGRFFEDIPSSELGRPNLILDPIGVMSYTAHPSEVLRKYLEILAPGGDIYLFMDGARIDMALRRHYTLPQGMEIIKKLTPAYANRYRWQVKLENGREVFFFDWLESLNQPDLEVKELETRMVLSFEKNGERYLRENRYTTFRIRKTGDGAIRIPELELIKVDATSNPPGRHLKEIPDPKHP